MELELAGRISVGITLGSFLEAGSKPAYCEKSLTSKQRSSSQVQIRVLLLSAGEHGMCL